jgi:hypothetical protein
MDQPGSTLAATGRLEGGTAGQRAGREVQTRQLADLGQLRNGSSKSCGDVWMRAGFGAGALWHELVGVGSAAGAAAAGIGARSWVRVCGGC